MILTAMDTEDPCARCGGQIQAVVLLLPEYEGEFEGIDAGIGVPVGDEIGARLVGVCRPCMQALLEAAGGTLFNPGGDA